MGKRQGDQNTIIVVRVSDACQANSKIKTNFRKTPHPGLKNSDIVAKKKLIRVSYGLAREVKLYRGNIA
jgi:hypothetical protein